MNLRPGKSSGAIETVDSKYKHKPVIQVTDLRSPQKND